MNQATVGWGVLILAAGKGTRMKSVLPKVAHHFAGTPMLLHVVARAQAAEPARVAVVLGHGRDQVEALLDPGVDVVHQEEQKGTGHAVAITRECWGDEEVLVVLSGDTPLVPTPLIRSLAEAARDPRVGVAMATMQLPDPHGYGRILRDESGGIVGIVEEKDASAAQRAITEVNPGIYAFRLPWLWHALERVDDDNVQGELYLTDVIALARADHMQVVGVEEPEGWLLSGINSRQQLVALENRWMRQTVEAWMSQGVTCHNPEQIRIEGQVTLGHDVSLHGPLVLQGKVEIASGVLVEPYCLIRDSRIGPDAVIHAYSHMEQAPVEAGVQLGPYARLRPGAQLQEGAKVGNFVEIKKAVIGPGAKVNHLSYIGDASVGAGSNIGAGVITCNYDGYNKFRTEIGAGAFIGSDCQLVAPVTVGDGAIVGAGTTVTGDVPSDALAVSRTPQKNIEGYAAKKRMQQRKKEG